MTSDLIDAMARAICVSVHELDGDDQETIDKWVDDFDYSSAAKSALEVILSALRTPSEGMIERVRDYDYFALNASKEQSRENAKYILNAIATYLSS